LIEFEKLRLGNDFTTETEGESLIGRAELITPTFSQLELVAATESIVARESDSQSVKGEEGKVIDCGSTAGGPRVKTEEDELIDYGSTAGGPH
jgi:hypothetical protein